MKNKKIFGVKTEILENGLLYSDNNHKVRITFNVGKEGKVLDKTQSSLYIEKFNNEDDIELITKDNKVKENIIIHKQKESYKYIYNLELENLILKEKDKQYFFLDKSTKKEVFKLSEFIMFDSNNKESKNIKVKVKEIDESNIVLEVIPSKRWMNSKVRKFPVVLDPSIESVSTDFITFISSSYQSLIDEQGLGRVGFISSVSKSLTIQVNLEGVMNEIERRGKKDTNYKVLLRLPFKNKTTKESGIFLLSNSSVSSKCRVNSERVLTFDITNIVKQLYLGSYRTTTFTLSHASPSLSGSDYIDVLIKETDDSKEPSLILNYELDDASFDTKKGFIQEAGTTYIDLCNGRFIHKKNVGKIKHNALSLPLNLVLNSNLLFDKSVDTKEKHLTRGWKTSFHQYIKKTGEFIEPLKTNTIHYIDGDGFSHLLIDRWYYEEDGIKKYVNESDVFTNDEGVVFTLVGTVEVALKCECTNDEGLVYLANVSEEDEVRDIILDHNKNMLGFDKNGRLIMIQDGYGNTIQVVYGTLNDRNKIMSIESASEKIVFEYDDNDLLCRIIDQYGKTIKLLNGSINGYKDSMTLLINENKYQFINASSLYYINDTLGKIKRLYISNQKVTKVEEYFTGNVDEENNPFSGTQDKGNIYTYTYSTGSTTEVITKFHKNYYSKTNTYEFDNAGRLIKSKNYKNEYVVNEYSGKNLTKEYSFNKTNDLVSDIKSSGISTVVTIEQSFNTTGMFAYVIEHNDTTKAKNITFDIGVYKVNDDGSYTSLTSTSKSYFEVENTVICAFKVPKGHKIYIKPYNSTTLASSNITAMYIVRVNGNEHTYDKDDHLINSSNALSETVYEDYQNDNPTKVTTTDLENNDVMVTRYNYDSNNRLICSEDHLGNVEEMIFDDKGQLVMKKSYNKKEPTLCTKERFKYDDKGNMTSLDGVMKDKDGNIPSTEIEYCRGLESQVKSPSGKVTNYGYDFNTDNLLSLSSEVDGVSHVNRFKYKRNLLESLEHDGFKVGYTYDKEGRRTSTSVNDETYITTEYNDNYTLQEAGVYYGNKVTNTYNNEHVESVVYDMDGYLKREYKDSSYKSYTYDKYDNITKVTSSDGNINKTYTYDEYNNLVSESDSGRYSKSFTYDTRHRVTNETNIYNSKTFNYNFTYNEENKSLLDKVSLTFDETSLDKELEYDALNRVKTQSLNINNEEFIKDEFEYLCSDDNTLSLTKEHNVSFKGTLLETNTYEYDLNGNIIKVVTNEDETRYHYDSLSRLIREDNPLLNKTITYKYDKRGNILLRKEYEFTLEESLLNPLKVDKFTYSKEGWKDQLVKYNDESFVYDSMGRPTTYRGMTTSWNNDGTLSNMGGKYAYIRRNFDGMFFERREGVYPNNFFTTIVEGNKILVDGNLTFIYILEKLVGFIYNGSRYFYQRNIQGDITSIYNESGTLVAKYVYDAYGRHKVLNASLEEDLNTSSIGNLNPFRYRGYYYDRVLGLYFLISRYYDPETCRFISPDVISILDETRSTINGLNLYMYCMDNPIMMVDPSGYFAISTFLIGLAISWAVSSIASYYLGEHLVSGSSSVYGGVQTIATGVSLLAYGPVGWVLGGAAIFLGAVNIAFGTAELQQHFTGNNWINDIGITGGLYTGLYVVSSIASSVVSVGGTAYMNSSAGKLAHEIQHNAKHWNKGTFKTKFGTLKYHLKEHGRGLSPTEYTNRALSFYDDYQSLLKPNYSEKYNMMRYIYKNKIGVGYYDESGYIIDFIVRGDL